MACLLFFLIIHLFRLEYSIIILTFVIVVPGCEVLSYAGFGLKTVKKRNQWEQKAYRTDM